MVRFADAYADLNKVTTAHCRRRSLQVECRRSISERRRRSTIAGPTACFNGFITLRSQPRQDRAAVDRSPRRQPRFHVGQRSVIVIRTIGTSGTISTPSIRPSPLNAQRSMGAAWDHLRPPVRCHSSFTPSRCQSQITTVDIPVVHRATTATCSACCANATQPTLTQVSADVIEHHINLNCVLGDSIIRARHAHRSHGGPPGDRVPHHAPAMSTLRRATVATMCATSNTPAKTTQNQAQGVSPNPGV
jgi:hypothetical protein